MTRRSPLAPREVVGPAAIAVALKAQRKRDRRDRKTIAREIGVATGTLVKWECGERVPTLAHARGWARALGMELRLSGWGVG